MAVADGVGGNYGGEIASKIVIDQCKKIFGQFVENPKTENLRKIIRSIYSQSREIFKESILQKNDLKNMGTTLTMVVGYKNEFVIGNIGDSRTYLIQHFQMKQITKDHSYLEEYKEQFPGVEIQEVMKVRLGHIITRSISNVDETIDIYPKDKQYFSLGEKDVLLLCSDGMIPDQLNSKEEFIAEMFSHSDSIKEFVNKIVKLAFEEGSKDNISVVAGCRNYSGNK